MITASIIRTPAPGQGSLQAWSRAGIRGVRTGTGRGDEVVRCWTRASRASRVRRGGGGSAAENRSALAPQRAPW